MGVSLSIKDVPEDVVARLKIRALRNHRSLQGELRSIVEDASSSSDQQSIRGILRVARELNLPSEPLGVDIIRADRDRR